MNDNKALVDRAIAYFDDAVRESDEIISEHNCSPALQAELAEQKGYFVTALASMRENTELRAQLAAVMVERDAAVECIRDIQEAAKFQRLSAIRVAIAKWRGAQGAGEGGA